MNCSKNEKHLLHSLKIIIRIIHITHIFKHQNTFFKQYLVDQNFKLKAYAQTYKHCIEHKLLNGFQVKS